MKKIIYLMCLLIVNSPGDLYAQTNRIEYTTDSFATLNNSKIYFHEKGTGNVPVIFVSGLGEDHSTWKEVQDSVSKFALTLSYDRSGLGKSGYNNEEKDLHSMADELNNLINVIRLNKPVVLVGHSLGCQIVKAYASRYPKNIKAIVFIDPGFDERKLQSAEAESIWQKRQQLLKKYLPQFNKAQQKELDNLNMDCATADSITMLPHVPTILFTATLTNPDFPGSDTELKVKEATHQHWLRYLPWAKHIFVATSRHYIQNDEPSLIVSAIQSIL